MCPDFNCHACRISCDVCIVIVGAGRARLQQKPWNSDVKFSYRCHITIPVISQFDAARAT